MTFELPMGMGSMDISGHCEGVRVDSVDTEDLSQDLVLAYGVVIKGVGIRCVIEGNTSSGSLHLDVALAGSAFNVTAELLPYHSEEFPELPLPLGGMNLTSCEAGIAISNLDFSGNSSLVMIMGSFDKDVLIELIAEYMQTPACKALQHLVATNGTAAIREGISMTLPLLSPPPALSQPRAIAPVMDWAEYPPVTVINALFEERFSKWADRVVELLKMSTLDAELVKTNEVSLILRSLDLEGLVDKRKPGLSLNGDEQQLDLFSNFSGLTLQATFVLQVTLPDQPKLTEVITLTGGINNFSLSVRAYMDRSALTSQSVTDFRHSPNCFVKAAEGTTEQHNASIAIDQLSVALRPFLIVASYGNLERDAVVLINTVLASLFHGYMPTTQMLVNGGLGAVRQLMNKAIWDRLDHRDSCSEDDLRVGVSSEALTILSLAAPVVAVLGVLLGCLAQSRWGTGRGAAPEASSDAPSDGCHEERCLAMEPFVPWFVKVFYPFSLLAVLMLFLYADLDLGATVSVVMAADGKSALLGPAFAFSLLGTVVDSWASGAILISVLALVASGVWPLIKLTLLLVAWVVPPSRLSRSLRGRILYFLDVFGKYSFLDSWFLVLTLNAFALEWHSVGDNAFIKVETTPLRAFYLFFLATALSLVLGHIASEVDVYAARVHHRLSASSDLAALAAAELVLEEQAPAAKHCAAEETSGDARVVSVVSRDDLDVEPAEGSAPQGESDSSVSGVQDDDSSVATVAEDPAKALQPLCRFAKSRLERVGLALALISTLGLVAASVAVTSFDFYVDGILSETVFNSHVHKEYSLTTVGLSVSSALRSDIGLLVLETAYIFSAVVLPLATILAILALWVLPMGLALQEIMVRVCYIADSWASFDVAVVVLVLGTLQFGRLSQFLVHKSDLAAPCSKIKDMTMEECLQIDMVARPTIYLLFVTFLVSIVVPKIAVRMCATSIFRKVCILKRCSSSPKDEAVASKIEDSADCRPEMRA